MHNPVLYTVLANTPTDLQASGGNFDSGDIAHVQGPPPWKGYYSYVASGAPVPPTCIAMPGGYFEPFSGAALPSHNFTHSSGGSDALVVDPKTATDQSQTTGASVNSATANVSTNDPGHAHGITDPGHAHVIDATTATNGVLRRAFHESFDRIDISEGGLIGDLDQTVAVLAAPAPTGHAHNVEVTFPAAWIGGTITVNGTDTSGLPISETFIKPVGGGTVVGLSPFLLFTNMVNSAPVAGPSLTASIVTGTKLSVSYRPVAQFLKACFKGIYAAFNAADLVNGTFDIVGGHAGNFVLEVWYTTDFNIAQNPHTHAAQNATTGLGVNSGTTGVTASDSGHSHGVTDPGHAHTQNAHDHTLST